MYCSAIVVGGGRGDRFGASEPKQFLPLHRRPMLLWAAEAFVRSKLVKHLQLVVPEDYVGRTRQLMAEQGLDCGVCVGGATRSASVRAGLAALPPATEIVAVHDAARPLVSPTLIERVLQSAFEHGAVVPALPIAETVKRVSAGWVSATVDRRALWAVQTPQAFTLSLLQRAHRALREGTDDAQLVEECGERVHVVEGERSNIKVTTPADAQNAESWLRARDGAGVGASSAATSALAPRVGTGYDVHRLVTGRPLILAGVLVPFHRGLLGHSDADVLAHAVADALLGAAALGDIGQHFPDDDPAHKDADSLQLLRRVVTLLAQRGLAVANLDCTVVCQRPKLAPHVPQMRSNLARCLGLGQDRVNVKATTTEQLGFPGRGEGIEAHACAMVVQRG